MATPKVNVPRTGWGNNAAVKLSPATMIELPTSTRQDFIILPTTKTKITIMERKTTNERTISRHNTPQQRNVEHVKTSVESSRDKYARENGKQRTTLL